jgi:hypothetical protein
VGEVVVLGAHPHDGLQTRYTVQQAVGIVGDAVQVLGHGVVGQEVTHRALAIGDLAGDLLDVIEGFVQALDAALQLLQRGTHVFTRAGNLALGRTHEALEAFRDLADVLEGHPDVARLGLGDALDRGCDLVHASEQALDDDGVSLDHLVGVSSRDL